MLVRWLKLQINLAVCFQNVGYVSGEPWKTDLPSVTFEQVVAKWMKWRTSDSWLRYRAGRLLLQPFVKHRPTNTHCWSQWRIQGGSDWDFTEDCNRCWRNSLCGNPVWFGAIVHCFVEIIAIVCIKIIDTATVLFIEKSSFNRGSVSNQEPAGMEFRCYLPR